MNQDDTNDDRSTRRGFLKQALGYALNPSALRTSELAGIAGASITAARLLSSGNVDRGAVLVEEENYPRLHRLYREFCSQTRITPCPRLYVIPSKAAVAFYDQKSLLISGTLVELLNDDELTAVLEHEMGHSTSTNQAMVIAGGAIKFFCSMHTAKMLGQFLRDPEYFPRDTSVTRRKFLNSLIRIAQILSAGVTYTVVGDGVNNAVQINADCNADPKHLASALQKILQYEKDSPEPDIADFGTRLRLALLKGRIERSK